jgi:BirA family transcriptional regulator, biotin operon repressor / biotin---[acetyl-CoA-carboxylase] ligase
VRRSQIVESDRGVGSWGRIGCRIVGPGLPIVATRGPDGPSEDHRSSRAGYARPVDSARDQGPPAGLVRALVEGPSPVAAVEWHAELDSTNRRAADAAVGGAPEIHVVLADVQTAGRGRLDRSWTAPPGTSLLVSCVLRPPVPAGQLGLLPLLAGLVLAEAATPFAAPAEVALKWPNDLLVDGRKAAGVLVETVPGEAAAPPAVVVGIGLNVDWRDVGRPPELAGAATSLAEAAGGPVDRWRVLAALLGVLGQRYAVWCELPGAFLDGYRRRCATLGTEVTVTGRDGSALRGVAVGIAGSGALQVRSRDGRVHDVVAGDVVHVRPAGGG